MKAKHLYIIGPITGKEDDNRKEFERAKAGLDEAGFRACTPFDVVPQDSEYSRLWSFCMKHSLGYIAFAWDIENEPPRFGIALLPGWEQSKGATIEHDLAVALGIPCKPWREWMEACNG